MQLYEAYSSDELMCTGLIKGKSVQVPHKLEFSFYFSQQPIASRRLRVLVDFRSDKLNAQNCGELLLCEDWTWTPFSTQKYTAQQFSNMVDFFKTYKILFDSVWVSQLDEGSVEDYFHGELALKELISSLECYKQNKELLHNVQTIEELSTIVNVSKLYRIES